MMIVKRWSMTALVVLGLGLLMPLAAHATTTQPASPLPTVEQPASAYDASSVRVVSDNALTSSEETSHPNVLSFGLMAKIVAAKSTAAETRMTTVLGSGRDVAPYANRPGFNVLNMDNLPASEWPRQNALWLNQAIRRGDDIWLLTDPAKHTQLMQQLGKSSYYLDLELPMLQQYNGVNAIPKYITSP